MAEQEQRTTRRQVLMAGMAGAVGLALPRAATAATAPDGSLRLPPLSTGNLTGKTVTIDPGHNGHNWTNPSYINASVWNGREDESCDTCGAETDAGYTEAEFNFTMANLVSNLLRKQGATVFLTRPSNVGVGPCVPTRAAIGNLTHSNVALSIHADGGPPDGYGFTLLEPVADGINDEVIAASKRLATSLRSALLSSKVNPISNYDGVDGVQPRDDLGGLNLTLVPKIMIECANMRNSSDAAKLTSPTWRATTAASLASGLTAFLLG